MTHVVLLGDSIFDNGSYVRGAPDVRAQLAHKLSGGAQVTLVAQDGALISNVAVQIREMPATATHVVISAGGNDALRASGLLDQPASSVSEALEKVWSVAEAFAQSYRSMLAAIASAKLPVAVCTIYDPPFADRRRRRIAAAALATLNDQIVRAAISTGAALIDLRLICDHDEDFANEIEPSSVGGDKIASAIQRFVSGRPTSAAFGPS
jgi:lysophospholipase L1-like esterase